MVTGAGAGAGGAAVARRLAELGARSVVCLEQGDWMRWSANPNVRRWTADHPAESVAEVEDVTGDNETLLVCADDSYVAEPLCDLLPRLEPRIDGLAGGLTGTRSALSNDRAREVLGWRPREGWRAPAGPG